MEKMSYGVNAGASRRPFKQPESEVEVTRHLDQDEEQARLVREAFEEAKRLHQGGRRRPGSRYY